MVEEGEVRSRRVVDCRRCGRRMRGCCWHPPRIWHAAAAAAAVARWLCTMLPDPPWTAPHSWCAGAPPPPPPPRGDSRMHACTHACIQDRSITKA